MDLKEFVRESILQVVSAISEAQPKARELGADICPSYANVGAQLVTQSMYVGTELASFFDFDVALTASDAQTGGAGLKVVAGLIGGGFGGELKTENATVSRLRFRIPVMLPSPGSLRQQPDQNTVDRIR